MKGKSEKKGKTYEEMYGRERAKEIKENHRKNMIGKNKNNTKELWKNSNYRNHMIEVHKGKKCSNKTKEKMRLSHKGVKFSEKHKQKLRHPKTKEHALNISKGILKYYEKMGISKEPYSNDWTSTLKRAIRERDNYICQICSMYGQVVHHIDYNKKNCNCNNLLTLCNSCHSKTNQSRNKWKLKLKEIIKWKYL